MQPSVDSSGHPTPKLGYFLQTASVLFARISLGIQASIRLLSFEINESSDTRRLMDHSHTHPFAYNVVRRQFHGMLKRDGIGALAAVFGPLQILRL